MKKFFPGLVSLVLVLAGCSQTMNAIQHAKLRTNVNMSDTIFLDAEMLAKNVSVKLTPPYEERL